jgi:hypothetical protein
MVALSSPLAACMRLNKQNTFSRKPEYIYFKRNLKNVSTKRTSNPMNRWGNELIRHSQKKDKWVINT